MGEHDSNPLPEGGTAGVISRLVDGEGAPADWQAFRSMADRDPTLWRELAEFQHDHAELSAYVNQAISVADQVEVDVSSELRRRFAERMRIVATWGGWAAAAAVAIAWTTALRSGPQSGPQPLQGGLNPIPIAAPQTATEAFNEYLDKGKQTGLVVGEVPTRVLVEARPVKSGGYEVLYLRQVLERRTVRELSTLATDEFGNPVPIPATSASMPLQGYSPSTGGPY